RDRMARACKYLEYRARDPHALLDRLIRVVVGAQRDRLADIARSSELRFQHSGGVRLIEETRLEIETGREPQVGVTRAGVAVTAGMAASPIGIHRIFERNVRRIVAGDDFARAIGLETRG